MPYEIRAHADGYRRGGQALSTTPTRYPDDAFSAQQLEQLKADPRVMIRRVESPPSEPDHGDTPGAETAAQNVTEADTAQNTAEAAAETAVEHPPRGEAADSGGKKAPSNKK